MIGPYLFCGFFIPPPLRPIPPLPPISLFFFLSLPFAVYLISSLSATLSSFTCHHLLFYSSSLSSFLSLVGLLTLLSPSFHSDLFRTLLSFRFSPSCFFNFLSALLPFHLSLPSVWPFFVLIIIRKWRSTGLVSSLNLQNKENNRKKEKIQNKCTLSYVSKSHRKVIFTDENSVSYFIRKECFKKTYVFPSWADLDRLRVLFV